MLAHILKPCVVENLSDGDNQQSEMTPNKTCTTFHELNVLWLWAKWYIPPVLVQWQLWSGGDLPCLCDRARCDQWKMRLGLPSSSQTLLNSSLNTCNKREKHFIELFNLKSLLDILAGQQCQSPPTFLNISLCCGVFLFLPWGSSSAGACADAFWSQWVSAYLIKWLSKQTLISGNCSASYSQWGNINFWSGRFWVPSALPGCQKVQLSNPAGIVWENNVDKYDQNVMVASPSSVIVLKQVFRRFPADMEKS